MSSLANHLAERHLPSKFKLYLKVRELKELNRILKSIQLLTDEEREEWVSEYGELVNDAIDSFVDDSNSALDEVLLDDESLEMSQELVTMLRDTISTVEGIFDKGAILES